MLYTAMKMASAREELKVDILSFETIRDALTEKLPSIDYEIKTPLSRNQCFIAWNPCFRDTCMLCQLEGSGIGKAS